MGMLTYILGGSGAVFIVKFVNIFFKIQNKHALCPKTLNTYFTKHMSMLHIYKCIRMFVAVNSALLVLIIIQQ